MKRRHAFSLVELTIVIAILGIASAIAMPRYGSAVGRYRVEGAARRLVEDLEYARAAAQAAGANSAVSFDMANHRYMLGSVARPDGRPGPYVVDLSAPPYEASIYAVQLFGPTALVFDGHGMPDVGGAIVVGSNGLYRAILVSTDGAPAEQRLISSTDLAQILAGDSNSIDNLRTGTKADLTW